MTFKVHKVRTWKERIEDLVSTRQLIIFSSFRCCYTTQARKAIWRDTIWASLYLGCWFRHHRCRNTMFWIPWQSFTIVSYKYLIQTRSQILSLNPYNVKANMTFLFFLLYWIKETKDLTTKIQKQMIDL